MAAVIDGVRRDLGEAREGTRNASLNRAAFRLGRLGLPLDEIDRHLTPIATAIGLGPHEIAATIRSGALAGLK